MTGEKTGVFRVYVLACADKGGKIAGGQRGEAMGVECLESGDFRVTEDS